MSAPPNIDSTASAVDGMKVSTDVLSTMASTSAPDGVGDKGGWGRKLLRFKIRSQQVNILRAEEIRQKKKNIMTTKKQLQENVCIRVYIQKT